MSENERNKGEKNRHGSQQRATEREQRVEHVVPNMLPNLAEEVYRAADRDLRKAYETYMGVKAGDQTLRSYTKQEYVDWLAKEFYFAQHVGGGPFHPPVQAYDMALRFLGGAWLTNVCEKMQTEDENVQKAVLERIKTLPPIPPIPPTHHVYPY